MLIAENVAKSYGDLKVLNGLSLHIKKGEIVSIVGASGAGKSTLLHVLSSLDLASSGKITIGNTELSKLSAKKLASFRNSEIGFVFQFHNLLPEFTAHENVCLPAYINNGNGGDVKKRALEMLTMLGLGERLDHKPSELSGGEQQRVAVARALINKPEIVFADEPSGNLDSASAKDLHQLFFKLRDQLNTTFIIVTHNDELANMADRKLTIRDGIIAS